MVLARLLVVLICLGALVGVIYAADPEATPAPTPAPAAETWAFPKAADTFDPASLLDLRSLNEKFAGEHGFVKLAADGNSFVRGDGQPLRLWASGARTCGKIQLPVLQAQARFLAKRGINAHRIFAMLPPTDPKADITSVNEAELDSLFRQIAAMREAGIYCIIDGFWPVSSKVQPGWDLGPGLKTFENLEYVNPKAQEAYKAWMKTLLTRPNPYTKIALKDDPAIAVIQLQNEDSLLWWGFGKDLPSLRKLYAQFLTKKYGSVEKAVARWQGYKADKSMPDDEENDQPGFLMTWDLTADGTKQKKAGPGFLERAADQLEFIAGVMHQFNADMADYLRKDLGCKQLINANNWRPADLTTMQDAQYWADSATEVMARNIYVGGMHSGVNVGWQVRAGQLYSDKCLLKSPRDFPTNVRIPMGHVFILPEVLWCPPNLYQAEAALVVAGQQSLTGLGAACWFCNYADGWEADLSGTKWTYSSPMQIGQFPAAALIYRKGYLKTGEPAIVDHRSLSDLWQRKTPLVSEEPGWDPNRDLGNRPANSNVKTALDPLAYLVGPVRVVFGSDASKSTAVDLDKYIDPAKQIVRSITGEIETDYGVGLYRINAPKAQAVVGFLAAAGPQTLADVEVDSKNVYAAVAVVSLDDKPLKDSTKVLVQMGTTARPTGWATTPAKNKGKDCFKITSAGKAPWQIEKTSATLTISNIRLTKATVLDANGMPVEAAVAMKSAGDKLVVTLPPNALYMILSAGN